LISHNKQVLQNLHQFFGTNLKKAIIAQELHKTGDLHLHCGVILHRLWKTKDPHALDALTAADSLVITPNEPAVSFPPKHGNYQVLKSVRGTTEYLTQSSADKTCDQTPLCYEWDISAIVSHKAPVSQRVALALLAGESLSSLAEKEPGYLLLHHQKCQSFKDMMDREEAKKKKSDLPLSFNLLEGGTEALEVVSWLTANVRKPRVHKQKQLWVHGTTNRGKTTLGMDLDLHLAVYWPGIEGTYDDDYEDGIYDIVIFDEFLGQRRLNWMNSFCEGRTFKVHRRYRDTLKKDNLPVIVLSNKLPAECYSNLSQDIIDTLLSRFTIITLSQFIRINISPA